MVDGTASGEGTFPVEATVNPGLELWLAEAGRLKCPDSATTERAVMKAYVQKSPDSFILGGGLKIQSMYDQKNNVNVYGSEPFAVTKAIAGGDGARAVFMLFMDSGVFLCSVPSDNELVTTETVNPMMVQRIAEANLAQVPSGKATEINYGLPDTNTHIVQVQALNSATEDEKISGFLDVVRATVHGAPVSKV